MSRFVYLFVASLFLSNSAVWAQGANLTGIRSAISAPTTEAPEPYKTIGPIPSDTKIIRYFFLFSCSFCAAYHDRVAGWSKTLPKDYKFEWMPVVFDQPSANMAAAFAAARLVATPAQLDLFMKESYRAVAAGKPSNQAKTWDEVAAKAGVKNFKGALSRVPSDFVGRLAQFEKTYELDRTPTMVIGGKYLITPDSVNGSESLFISLANGLVSKVMIEAQAK